MNVYIWHRVGNTLSLVDAMYCGLNENVARTFRIWCEIREVNPKDFDYTIEGEI